MQDFYPDCFFELEGFSHKEIWKKDDLVWTAIGTLETYLRSLKLGQIDIRISRDVVLERPELISIGKGTVIEPGVMIQGPCVIGKDCVIRHGAYLRENLIVGDRSVIGHSAELKNSMLLPGAAATHFVYVGDSILGSFVNLGAGVKCANLRLDRSEIPIWHNGKKMRTGLKKLGAIIGDRAQIGCNCVLNPGTLIGKSTAVYPLLNIGGMIPAKSIVKNQETIEPMENRLLDLMGGF